MPVITNFLRLPPKIVSVTILIVSRCVHMLLYGNAHLNLTHKAECCLLTLKCEVLRNLHYSPDNATLGVHYIFLLSTS